MEDYIPTILTFAFLIFCLDQQIITSLQRQGKYNPDTHETVMYRVFVWPFIYFLKRLTTLRTKTSAEQSTWMPEGDLSLFSYETTVCMNKLGQKVRLSYFFDNNQHAWYRVEKINANGIATESPCYEPAAVPFDVKKLQYV